MRDHGREGRNGDGSSPTTVPPMVRTTPEAEDAEPHRDLVFDFSQMDDISVHDLSVLLTAQRLATEEDRAVWAAGVQVETWHALHAMGLGHYFRPFPTSETREA